MYPSCNNCNHLKRDDELDFNLYYDKKPTLEINFTLDFNQIVDFYIGKVEEKDLKIIFDQGTTKLEEKLRISEIYENFADYAYDLLVKHKMYTESAIENLVESHENLLGRDKRIINRIIFGSTLDEKEINDRVFSKLNFDIKNQLNRLNSKI